MFNKIIDAIGTAMASVALVAAVLFIVALIIGFPVMWLWNGLVPELFGGPTISFWQAVGLFFLTNILFNTNSSGKKDA